MIGFLCRSAFWLSLVLIAIPFGGTTEEGRVIGPFEALSSARMAAADMMSVCDRQPRVCDTSRFAFGAAQSSLGDAANVSKAFFGKDQRDPAVTGTIPGAAKAGG